jgi:hypothetical protein
VAREKVQADEREKKRDPRSWVFIEVERPSLLSSSSGDVDCLA